MNRDVSKPVFSDFCYNFDLMFDGMPIIPLH